MDALIYTAMSGAEHALRAQQVHANNLANLETPGFRADLELATSETVQGYGYDTRHMSHLQADAQSGRVGAVRETGNSLDVALDGDALQLNGRAVLGDGGPIVLPPHASVAIAQDGTISILPPGEIDMQPVDRLKLVRADAAALTKNEAGLIVPRNGGTLAADDTASLKSGHLEGSNVSAVEEMVATMNLNREFELQMKLYKTADSMADTGNRLIRE